MKKTTFTLPCLLLCLLLCLSLPALLTACSDPIGPAPDQPTETGALGGTGEPPSDPSVDTPVETPPETPTETPSETPTEAPTGEGESRPPADSDYDPELYIPIRSADDLMELNRLVNEEGEFIEEKTVLFLNDIDLKDRPWTPLDGACLYDVTFDGQGHTVSNMEIVYNEENQVLSNEELGCGFVDIAYENLSFRDITFDRAHITAYERHVGCLVGKTWGNVPSLTLSFENVKVSNFTLDGWMDWNNQSAENGGHFISFRDAAFLGGHFVGSVSFDHCTAENIKLSGFHNLAAFVGYDATRMLDAFAFSDCHVRNADMTFSYCLSESYVVDQPRKFVSVFFNSANWADNIDECVEMDCDYEGVSFYDATDDNREYTPADFRSWTREEAAAAAGG